ncbi:MAG: hypothetical protein HYZ36_08935, partial [Pedosphaera parvula]|nr:hypothetical protein [Pedosphaera parvula]
MLKVRSAQGELNHLLYQGAEYSRTNQEVLARLRVTQFDWGESPRAGIGVGVGPNSQGINFTALDWAPPAGRHFRFSDDLRWIGPHSDLRWKENVWHWVRLRYQPNPNLWQPPADTFFIEAEDFNYEGGRSKEEADDQEYPGGLFEGLKGLPEIDFHSHNILGFWSDDPASQYRPSDAEDEPRVITYQSDDLWRPAGERSVNFGVGWNQPGQWMNYTRNFPPARYQIFARLSSNGKPIHAQLDEVTSGARTRNQVLAKLGQFKAPPTGGWNGWRDFAYVPLRDETGQAVVVALSGSRTVRFTVLPGDLNYDFLAFVPVPDLLDPNRPDFFSGDDAFAKVWPADGYTPEPDEWLPWEIYEANYRRGWAGITAGSHGAKSEFEVDYILIKADGLPQITVAPKNAQPGAVTFSLQPSSVSVEDHSAVTFNTLASGT